MTRPGHFSMSSLTRYYEGDLNFNRLVGWDEDQTAGASRQLALQAVLEQPVVGLDILDAGCGLGGFSKQLRGGNRVTGVDINERCLEFVSKQHGYATQCFDLEDKWPISAGAFDLVLLGDVLEHLFNTAEVLAEACRVLRPGARVVIAVPNVGYWRRRFRLLFTGELSRGHTEHIRFFSPRSLARQARTAGLEVQAVRSYSWNTVSRPRLSPGLAWGFAALLRPHASAEQARQPTSLSA